MRVKKLIHISRTIELNRLARESKVQRMLRPEYRLAFICYLNENLYFKLGARPLTTTAAAIAAAAAAAVYCYQKQS